MEVEGVWAAAVEPGRDGGAICLVGRGSWLEASLTKGRTQRLPLRMSGEKPSRRGQAGGAWESRRGQAHCPQGPWGPRGIFGEKI